MKKLFTLIAVSLLTVGAFAADRRPAVTLSMSAGYEVVIDGQSYFSNTGVLLDNGRQHRIQVFAAGNNSYNSYSRNDRSSRNSRFSSRVVDAATFQTGNDDLFISVDGSGRIIIENSRQYAARTGSYNNRNSDYGWRDGSRSRDRRTNDLDRYDRRY